MSQDDDIGEGEPENIHEASDERIAQLLTLQVGDESLRERLERFRPMLWKPGDKSMRRELIKLCWDCYMEGFHEGASK